MTTYNHAFTLAFETPSSVHPTGEDVTPQQIRSAIQRRLQCSDNELLEAVGVPFDTYEEE